MIRFFAFSVRQAFEGLLRNRVMSLAATVTMVLMLVLLASLVIVLSGMQAGLDFVESKVEIRAELNDGVPQERVDALQAQLTAMPQVASVVYVSKEEALVDFQRMNQEAGGSDLTQYVGFNPFPAQLSIKLHDPRESSQVISHLEAETATVARVIEQQKNIDRLVSVTALLRTIGLSVLALVGVTVLLIVVNSIRMAVMSRAQEIEIMRLVGASDSFIRWPFIFEGLLVGLIGAAITLALLYLASSPITSLANAIAGQVPVGFSQTLIAQVSVLVTLAGLGLGGVGAWISVRAYLRN
jgi:cell division transport system permease protein